MRIRGAGIVPNHRPHMPRRTDRTEVLKHEHTREKMHFRYFSDRKVIHVRNIFLLCPQGGAGEASSWRAVGGGGSHISQQRWILWEPHRSKTQRGASLWLLSLTDLTNEAGRPKDRNQFQFPQKNVTAKCVNCLSDWLIAHSHVSWGLNVGY